MAIKFIPRIQLKMRYGMIMRTKATLSIARTQMPGSMNIGMSMMREII